MKRTRISSGAPWEKVVGYSRAIKSGPFVFVSGTTATDSEGKIVGPEDPYAQTVQTIENIGRALEQAGGSLEDVVRTRIFVRRIADFDEIARAHARFFSEIRPAATLVEVSGFVSDEMLVEIEADAVLGTGVD